MGRVVFWLRIALSFELIERHGARRRKLDWLDWLNIEALSSRNKQMWRGEVSNVVSGFLGGEKNSLVSL